MTVVDARSLELDRARDRRARLPRAALALGAAALLAATFALAIEAAPGRGAAPRPPPLPSPDPGCGAVESHAARSRRAHAAGIAAAAKVARYPYVPAEGLAALELLLESATCHTLAGDALAAAAARARARAWRAHVSRDYRDRLIRYRLALASDRPRAALPEIAFLLELLPREASAFTRLLRRTQLELEETQPEVKP